MDAVEELEQPKKHKGWPPGLGHASVPEVPLRFYVQVSPRDLKALAAPPAMMDVLAKKLRMVHQPVKVPIRTTAFCETRVQLQWFKGSLVFMKGWKSFATKIKLAVGDTLVFKY